MNIQFETAFDILSNYYGLPNWEVKPKEGKSREEIVKLWCDELKGYTVNQVKEACYWLTRKKKTMTFPSINVLMNELFNSKKEADPNEEALRVYGICLEKYSQLASQRAVYDVYGVCIQGYDPKNDGRKLLHGK